MAHTNVETPSALTHVLFVVMPALLGTVVAAVAIWVIFSDPFWWGYVFIGGAGVLGREIAWRRRVHSGSTPRQWYR